MRLKIADVLLGHVAESVGRQNCVASSKTHLQTPRGIMCGRRVRGEGVFIELFLRRDAGAGGLLEESAPHAAQG
jgi:hypothetical protein